MNVCPTSTATCTARRPTSESTAPRPPPIGHAPNPITETSGPSWNSGRVGTVLGPMTVVTVTWATRAHTHAHGSVSRQHNADASTPQATTPGLPSVQATQAVSDRGANKCYRHRETISISTSLSSDSKVTHGCSVRVGNLGGRGVLWHCRSLDSVALAALRRAVVRPTRRAGRRAGRRPRTHSPPALACARAPRGSCVDHADPRPLGQYPDCTSQYFF